MFILFNNGKALAICLAGVVLGVVGAVSGAVAAEEARGVLRGHGGVVRAVLRPRAMEHVVRVLPTFSP